MISGLAQRSLEGQRLRENELPTATLPSSLVSRPLQPSSEAESEWLRRARKNDPAGYDALITAYRERALRLASGILNGREEAEDVVQEPRGGSGNVEPPFRPKKQAGLCKRLRRRRKAF